MYIPTLILLVLLNGISADVYYSLVRFTSTFNIERIMISALKDYVRIHEEKLLELRNILKRIRKIESSCFLDTQNEFLSKLTGDFDQIEELFKRDDADAVKSVCLHNQLVFPEEDDLDFTVSTILLLQDVYNFSVASLADGELAGVKFTKSFSAEECYEVAWRGLQVIPYSGCLDWFDVAVERGWVLW